MKLKNKAKKNPPTLRLLSGASSKRFIYFFLSVEFNNLFMNFLTLYFPNGKNLDALSDFFSRNAT